MTSESDQTENLIEECTRPTYSWSLHDVGLQKSPVQEQSDGFWDISAHPDLLKTTENFQREKFLLGKIWVLQKDGSQLLIRLIKNSHCKSIFRTHALSRYLDDLLSPEERDQATTLLEYLTGTTREITESELMLI